MKNDRLERLLTIVDTVLSLEPDRRPGYLTKMCGDDDILRDEVKKLLYSIDESEHFWDNWQDWNSKQIKEILYEPCGQDKLPEQIGSWKPVRLLGQGGMGSVYLTERADGQYEQQAAVKVLRHGLEMGHSFYRFEQERQILAKLDHPNIAGLYDGGITKNGRPWLAMQYVDGLSITSFCKKNNCSLEHRLKLIQKVCEAVQYAHRNLIVHRDLKPENILVTESGSVKVLDFGIAKLLDQELNDAHHIQTQTGLRIMSLDYAATEQITGESITTATDVYALGLILYELLTDKYPFDLTGKNHRLVEQTLIHQDPVKPSTVAPGWRKKLRGDLDAITLKALRKEPDQRYENAGQMLEDLNKYLTNQPVSARRDTIGYRLGKFYKRHSAKMAATTLVLIGIFSLVFYYTSQLTVERNQAQLQAKKAEQTSEFLKDLFQASDPGESLGATITAEDLLERGLQKIENSLEDEPEVKASLLSTLGSVYTNMGQYQKAQLQFEKSLDLRRNTLDPLHPEIAKNLNEISTTQLYMGNLQKAKIALIEALQIQRQAEEPVYENYASTLNNLSFIYLQTNELDSAEVLLRQAIDIRRNKTNTEPEQLAPNLDGLAMTLERKGDSYNAEKVYRESLELRQASMDPNHPDIARSLNNFAGFMYRKGDFESAELLYRQALDIWRKVLGNDHPDVARAYNNLAAVLEKQGDLKTAETMYRNALSIKRISLGDAHISTAYSLSNLGLVLMALRDYETAESLLIESLDIRRKNFDTPHPTLALGMNNLAELYRKKQDYMKAVPIYRDELVMRAEIDPVDSLKITQAKIGLGVSLLALNQFDDAETMLLETHAELKARDAAQPQEIDFVLKQLSDLYVSWGKHEKAEEYQKLISDDYILSKVE